ncbi:PAXNEB protein-domain-containing protein, partial [Jimgerdemannia flammicorona]
PPGNAVPPIPTTLQSKQFAAAALLSTTPTTQSPILFCHTYDLTKRIPAAAVEAASLSLIEIPSEFDDGYEDGQDDYAVLLERIRRVVEEDGFRHRRSTLPISSSQPRHPSSLTPSPSTGDRNALRIGIHSLASPHWRSRTSHVSNPLLSRLVVPLPAPTAHPTSHPQDLFRFFHALRGLLRFSYAAAVVTVPAYLYANDDAPGLMRRIEHVCDAVVEIESFAGSLVASTAPYAQTYHGLFRVHKLPALNSLLPSSTKLSVLSGGGRNNLGFRLRRKRFAIETFHLPPEGGSLNEGFQLRREKREQQGVQASLDLAELVSKSFARLERYIRTCMNHPSSDALAEYRQVSLTGDSLHETISLPLQLRQTPHGATPCLTIPEPSASHRAPLLGFGVHASSPVTGMMFGFFLSAFDRRVTNWPSAGKQECSMKPRSTTCQQHHRAHGLPPVVFTRAPAAPPDHVPRSIGMRTDCYSPGAAAGASDLKYKGFEDDGAGSEGVPRS